ncbi:CatB-related O-acetyltransferase [Mucilaginibacter sp.]
MRTLLFLRIDHAGTEENEAKFTNKISQEAKLGVGNEFQHPVFIDNNCQIGSNNYFGINTLITKTTIGNYCSIAPNVSIGMGEHFIDTISTNTLFYGNVYKRLTEQDCKIGNDVWIGVDAVILRGVKIGNGAVIGANAVVTKDIPDFAVAVGNPARVLKYRFNNEESSLISASGWWDIVDVNAAKEILIGLTTELGKRNIFD